MKKILTLSFILIGLLILSPLNAHACKNHENYSKSQNKTDKLKSDAHKIWRKADKINLTDEQKSKIKDIKHSALKKLIQQEANLDIIRVDFKAETSGLKLDVGKVNKLLDKKYDAKKKIAKTYIKAKSDIYNALTDAQLKKLHSKCGECASGKKCGQCTKKSKCDDCKKDKKCTKCKGKKDGICPITGKPLESSKGSMKGSDKGSMKE